MRPHSARVCAAALASLLLSVLLVDGAQAAPGKCAPPPPICRGSKCKIDVTKCGPVEEPRLPTGPKSVAAHPPLLRFVPTCPGNNATVGDLCDFATTSCPDPEDFRYWVYETIWDPVREAYGEPVQRETPPFVCAGPTEVAEADPRAAVMAMVRADWRTFGLPGSTVVVQPAGDTLVGAKTRFSTDSPSATTLPPKPILGLAVTLSIEASGYRWDFGDGSTQDADVGEPRVEHVYREAGPRSVSLRTFYTATFTIEGDDTVYPLQGTADVPGPPVEVLAREARTQLEGG